jgi:hypothetical protein
LHLEELAAAYEGRGFSVDTTAEASDHTTLAAVTALLLKHRAKQRERQRDALHGVLVRLLSDDYRAVRAEKLASAHDLQERIVETFKALGVRLTDENLDELVIPWDTDGPDIGTSTVQRTIKGCRGSVEAAKSTLSKILNRGTRTLAEARSRADWLPLARYAFGRWVNDKVRDTYVAELHSSQNQTPKSNRSLGSLGEIDELTGMSIDLEVGHLTQTLFTTELGLQTLFTSQPSSAGMRAIQEEFHARWSFRYSLILMLIAVAPDVAEEILPGVPDLAESVRDAVRNLLAARKGQHEKAVARAEVDLGIAIWNDLVDSVRKHWTDQLAVLDPNRL